MPEKKEEKSKQSFVDEEVDWMRAIHVSILHHRWVDVLLSFVFSAKSCAVFVVFLFVVAINMMDDDK